MLSPRLRAVGAPLLGALAFVSVICAAATRAQAQTIRTVARVLATSEVRGRFARPVCDGDLHLHAADTADLTYALVREAAADDRPLVLDLGDLLVPHGVARFAAENDPDVLARLVSSLGYRALALGEDDLGAPRASFVAVLGALRERGVPMIATNLRCAPSAQALCDVVVDASDGVSMHLVDGQRMGVVTMLQPRVLTHLSPEKREGLELEAPAEALPRAVRRAREQGAEIVVSVLGGDGADATRAALALVRELPPDGRPDLLFVAGAGEELLFARPASISPPIVAAPVNDAIEVRIRESDELADGFEMLAQPLRMRGITAAEPVRDFIDAIGPDYCADWGRTLPAGRLDEPLDASGIAELVARVLRDRAGADVAVFNRGAVDGRWRPAREGALSASDIYVALQYDEPLVVADVPDSWLRALGERRDPRDLVTPGLHRVAGGWRVAGQALATRASYRVVTIGYLARGGDDALPPLPRGLEWAPIERDSTLRTVVLDHFERADARDARQTVRDPERSTQWLLRATFDGTFSATSVENRAGYELGQLNLFEFMTFGVEGNVFLEARDPIWSWDSTLLVNYRTTWLPGEGEPGRFIEPADIVRLRSTFAWTGLRQAADQVYVPDLYVEGFLETEITPPAPSVRSFHSLYLRPTVGVRFPLLPELDVKLAAGLQSQVFDANSGVEPGFGAVLTLQPLELARIDERLIQIELTGDWFISDLGGVNRQQLRANGAAVFDLAGPLKMTLNFNFFLQSDDTRDTVGTYLSATAGLRLAWIGRDSP